MRHGDAPDLVEKVAVVTSPEGEGIGYGITYTLPVHYINKAYLVSTSEGVVKGAEKAITKELRQTAADKTKWFQCDLVDWEKTLEVTEQVKRIPADLAY